jgi:hypothetical protein
MTYQDVVDAIAILNDEEREVMAQRMDRLMEYIALDPLPRIVFPQTPNYLKNYFNPYYFTEGVLA